jgi:type VII secretion protein EccE
MTVTESAQQRVSGSVRWDPARRPGHIGDAGLGRLLVLELLLLAVLAAAGVASWLLIAGGVLLALSLLVMLSRAKGRWWTSYLMLRWWFRRRTRSARLSVPAADSAAARTSSNLVALRRLVPDLAVDTFESPKDGPVGVLRDEAGWFALVQLTPTTRGAATLPLTKLMQTLRHTRQPGAMLQVVVNTVGSPSVELAKNRCAASYQELMGSTGRIPADAALWLVVRLDAEEYGLALPDTEEPQTTEQINAIVTQLALRIVRNLQGERIRGQVLSSADAVEALARSLDLEQPATGGTASHELWDRWRSERLEHATFWVRRWPSPPKVAELLYTFAGVSAAQTSVSLTLRVSGDSDTDLCCLVRLATPPDGLPQGCTNLLAVANRLGAVLHRLNGEQATAAYATAPSGGGMR